MSEKHNVSKHAPDDSDVRIGQDRQREVIAQLRVSLNARYEINVNTMDNTADANTQLRSDLVNADSDARNWKIWVDNWGNAIRNGSSARVMECVSHLVRLAPKIVKDRVQASKDVRPSAQDVSQVINAVSRPLKIETHVKSQEGNFTSIAVTIEMLIDKQTLEAFRNCGLEDLATARKCLVRLRRLKDGHVLQRWANKEVSREASVVLNYSGSATELQGPLRVEVLPEAGPPIEQDLSIEQELLE